MDWTDFVFPAKHVMDKIGEGARELAAHGAVTNETGIKGLNPANLDIGKMAESSAQSQGRGDQFKPHNQPTMSQLKGMGGLSTPCPTCGK